MTTEKFLKNNKGFTLIELIISLGITSFLALMIMSFFTVNLKSFSKIRYDAELQFQAQYILNFITKRVMESKNIEDIKNGYESVIKTKDEYTISNLSLRYGDDSNNCYLFRVANKKIYCGKGKKSDSASSELGAYVEELRIKPFPDGDSFDEAKALIITVVLAKETEKYVASQLIYMRLS